MSRGAPREKPTRQSPGEQGAGTGHQGWGGGGLLYFFKKNILQNGPDLMDSKRNVCLKMFQEIR